MYEDLKKLSEEEMLEKIKEYSEKIKESEDILNNYHKTHVWDADKRKNDFILVDSRTMKKASPEIANLYVSTINMKNDIGILYGLIRQKKSKKLTKFIFKFISVDKRLNPELYPDWLTFVIENVTSGGYIRLLPVVNLFQFLKEKGKLTPLLKIFNRIKEFWRKYIGESNLSILGVKYEGFDEYAKQVFNKEIRKRIKEEVDPNGILHSVVFRKPVEGHTYYSILLFQIAPRYKKQASSYYQSKREVRYNLKKLLEEYGWIENENYQTYLEKT